MLVREWQYYCTCDVCNQVGIGVSGVTRDQAIIDIREAGWKVNSGGRRCVCPNCCKAGGRKNVSENRSRI